MKQSTLFAFLGGAAIGAVAALLLAPDKGSETRRKLKETFDEEINHLRDKINNFVPDMDEETA